MTEGNPAAGFRRWRGLLFDLAADVHPDRWAAVGVSGAARERLIACDRSRHTLSRNLSWIVPDAATFEGWDLTVGGAARWALARGEELWKYGLLAGAAIHRDAVTRMVWRQQIVAFKQTVGEDVYLFALRQAPLMHGGGGIPAPDAADADGAVEERVTRSAGLALGCWLAGLERELAARARLKLPLVCDAALDEAAMWAGERRTAWVELMERVAALRVGSQRNDG